MQKILNIIFMPLAKENGFNNTPTFYYWNDVPSTLFGFIVKATLWRKQWQQKPTYLFLFSIITLLSAIQAWLASWRWTRLTGFLSRSFFFFSFGWLKQSPQSSETTKRITTTPSLLMYESAELVCRKKTVVHSRNTYIYFMEETCHANVFRNLRNALLERDPNLVIPKLLLCVTSQCALELLSGRSNFNSEAADKVPLCDLTVHSRGGRQPLVYSWTEENS